jgi:hypothetical protein
MIGLDHNHPAPLSPNSKHNLILPTSDPQHILPWEPHLFLSESANPVQPDSPSLPRPSDPAVSHPGPITPVDAEDPVLAPLSPPSPADAADRSSSLTPPPDSASPQQLVEPSDEPSSAAHLPETSENAEPAGEVEGDKEAAKEDEEEQMQVEKLSGRSTPLSELSAPDQTGSVSGDSPPTKPPEMNAIEPDAVSQPPEESVADVNTVMVPEISSTSTDAPKEIPEPAADTSSSEELVTLAPSPPRSSPPRSSPPRSSLPRSSPPRSSPSGNHQPLTTESKPQPEDTLPITSDSPTDVSAAIAKIQPTPLNLPPSATPPPPSKVVTILELNAELLRWSKFLHLNSLIKRHPEFQLNFKCEAYP